jgi:hypothetical protein
MSLKNVQVAAKGQERRMIHSLFPQRMLVDDVSFLPLLESTTCFLASISARDITINSSI